MKSAKLQLEYWNKGKEMLPTYPTTHAKPSYGKHYKTCILYNINIHKVLLADCSVEFWAGSSFSEYTDKH